MAFPMCDQPPTQPALALASSDPSRRHRPSAVPRLPAPVYWFRRALGAAVLLLFLWASSLLAAELRWGLTPEDPPALNRPEPGYIIVGDTALRVSSDSR